MPQRRGLTWVADNSNEPNKFYPEWTEVPNSATIELLARRHLQLMFYELCYVEFYAEGDYHKVYKVQTSAGNFIMRVALPVDPFFKTNSEVATINFIRQTTNIPAPRIIAFADSADNELGFEWILMEMLPGTTLCEKWKTFSLDVKQELVKQIAKYNSQLFRRQFSSIGNIFTEPMEGMTTRSQPPKGIQNKLPVVGRIVSQDFCREDRINYDVPRGPFANSQDWYRAYLALIQLDQEDILKVCPNNKDALRRQDCVAKLMAILPTIFPADDGINEPSILFHADLHDGNILVDDNGKITGIIDWECVSAMPLWRACGRPKFLLFNNNREAEPNKNDYTVDKERKHEVVDNQGASEEYWEDLKEYELIVLSRAFLRHMKVLEPGWFEVYKKKAERARFQWAVDCIEDNTDEAENFLKEQQNAGPEVSEKEH